MQTGSLMIGRFAVRTDAGEPNKVAKVLEKVCLYKNLPHAIATELIKNHGFELTPDNNLSATDYRYPVNMSYGSIIVYDARGNELFNDYLYRFYPWAKNFGTPDLRNAVDKVVKFTYKGGSGSGQRIVKLTSVLGSGNGTVLKGWDIEKSTGGKIAFRSYKLGNIVGNIEIIG
jgi:hypothetical protein